LARACATIEALSEATGVDAGSAFRNKESAEYAMKGDEEDPAFKRAGEAAVEEPAAAEEVAAEVADVEGDAVLPFGVAAVEAAATPACCVAEAVELPAGEA
jgi:hypothetical protein